MRKLLRDNRGSVAFATVIALVPIIGVMALGAEVTTWYVTKQQAQAAADAAAYSGALKMACDLATPTFCTDKGTGITVQSRGEQFAALNAFCNLNANYSGCTTLAAGVSQSVVISEPGEHLVKATVSQTQPAYLAKILGLTNVTIGATATAKAVFVANPCVISLQDPIALKGGTTVNSSSCGLASNSTASNSIDFTGNGITIDNVNTISGQGGCKETGTGGDSRCVDTITYAPPVFNPLSGLDTPMASLSTANFSRECAGSAAVAYDSANTATQCYNDRINWNSNVPLPTGVYFFTGELRINGGANITGTGVTLILLPGATLSINGNPEIKLTALSTVTTSQVPPALSSVVGLMSNLLFFISETTTTTRIQGNSTSYFNGITYAPKAAIEYTGNAGTASTTCNQIIAKAVTLGGSSTFDNSGCPESSKSEIYTVQMWE